MAKRASPARRAYPLQCGRLVSALTWFAIGAAVPGAAFAEWLKLQAPRFGVISQLDETSTRRWAIEFDQFVDVLHQLYAVEHLALPPLTIVLFDRPRDFAPYQNRTESGQANVAGFFANTGSWSVIGLAGRRRTAETRLIVYHEAAHWFASASDVELPLWLEEGLAEVLSTFEVASGKGRWGTPPPGYVDHLNYIGLLPMEQFLSLSQDAALHGSGSYYPQAWAFVHYLLLGNNGAERGRLEQFLAQLRDTDRETAFITAFGKPYRQVTSDLRSYLQRGRYGVAIVELPDRDREMSVEPASPAHVEFALARLATAGGNDALAKRHVDTVLSMAPRAAPAYDLLAMLAQKAEDRDAFHAAVDKAVELGSDDAMVHAAKGWRILDDERPSSGYLDERLEADRARAAAESFGRAIALQPRNRLAYEGLAIALMNTNLIDERDQALLAVGRRALPTYGVVLAGQAALERQRGHIQAALQLLRQARVEPFELPARLRAPLLGVHDAWLADWLSSELGSFAASDRFRDAHSLLDEQLADPMLPESSRRRVETMKTEFGVFERLTAAAADLRAGRVEQARRDLQSLLDDPSVNTAAKRQARRLLETSE
jgi:tetratricopeptide (TPR) repeat protein